MSGGKRLVTVLACPFPPLSRQMDHSCAVDGGGLVACYCPLKERGRATYLPYPLSVCLVFAFGSRMTMYGNEYFFERRTANDSFRREKKKKSQDRERKRESKRRESKQKQKWCLVDLSRFFSCSSSFRSSLILRVLLQGTTVLSS